MSGSGLRKKIMISAMALAILAGALLGLAVWHGVFLEVGFGEREIGPLVMACRERLGDYKDSGRAMKVVHEGLVKDFNLKTTVGVGIYYDDPRITPKDKLRANLCWLLEAGNQARIVEVSARYNVLQLGRQKYAAADFPYRTRLSIIIGVLKVYPALSRHVLKHGIRPTEIIEIYDAPAGVITYAKRIP